MTKQRYSYDFLVFIGRFQPFHTGHKAVVDRALREARQVIILCGSAYRPRSIRDPWLFSERETMMRGAFEAAENKRIHISPLLDVMYNDELWVQNVQKTVSGVVAAHHERIQEPAKIGLVGHNKDSSSYYLQLFPQWGSVAAAHQSGLNATDLRAQFFAGEKAISADAFPVSVAGYLRKFQERSAYKAICDEFEFVQRYKSGWEKAPYAPTFVTVDAVVVQSGHVLLVERKAHPGKGLLALPGGFIDQKETLLTAAIRELREETKLKVPEPVLKGSLKAQAVFDDPYRSSRGRTVTHGFLFQLQPELSLPRVKGSDDAKKALWLPLGELDPKQMFEDHYFIIQKLLGSNA